jgi:hypothetical protein
MAFELPAWLTWQEIKEAAKWLLRYRSGRMKPKIVLGDHSISGFKLSPGEVDFCAVTITNNTGRDIRELYVETEFVHKIARPFPPIPIKFSVLVLNIIKDRSMVERLKTTEAITLRKGTLDDAKVLLAEFQDDGVYVLRSLEKNARVRLANGIWQCTITVCSKGIGVEDTTYVSRTFETEIKPSGTIDSFTQIERSLWHRFRDGDWPPANDTSKPPVVVISEHKW